MVRSALLLPPYAAEKMKLPPTAGEVSKVGAIFRILPESGAKESGLTWVDGIFRKIHSSCFREAALWPWSAELRH
jgi:hypothetical protein